MPHRTGKCGTKLFFGGTGCRAGAHRRPAFSKNTNGPVAIPLLEAPQAPGNKPNPPEGGKSLGDPPEAGGNLQIRECDLSTGVSAENLPDLDCLRIAAGFGIMESG